MLSNLQNSQIFCFSKFRAIRYSYNTAFYVFVLNGRRILPLNAFTRVKCTSVCPFHVLTQQKCMMASKWDLYARAACTESCRIVLVPRMILTRGMHIDRFTSNVCKDGNLKFKVNLAMLIMPRWAEPRRHTVYSRRVCLCLGGRSPGGIR